MAGMCFPYPAQFWDKVKNVNDLILDLWKTNEEWRWCEWADEPEITVNIFCCVLTKLITEPEGNVKLVPETDSTLCPEVGMDVGLVSYSFTEYHVPERNVLVTLTF